GRAAALVLRASKSMFWSGGPCRTAVAPAPAVQRLHKHICAAAGTGHVEDGSPADGDAQDGLIQDVGDDVQVLELQAQALAQRAPLAGKIGDRVAVEDVEEGPEGIAQRSVEIAGIDQRAIDV